MLARRFFVGGLVQGVYYRASTRTEAVRLGLAGYAKNLPDGRVEVLAIGPPSAIEELQSWLWKGPPAAHVTDIEVEEVETSMVVDDVIGFKTH